MGAKEKIIQYIKDWEQKCYTNGIPDEVPIEINDLVPNYKKICVAIIKNEYNLESLGINREKCKIYSEIKRNEIALRNKNKYPIQLTFF